MDSYEFAFMCMYRCVDEVTYSPLGIDPWIEQINRSMQEKNNTLFKQYKVDKMANNVSGEGHHECKFYGSIDQWWHQTSTMMKHVSASTNDNDHISS